MGGVMAMNARRSTLESLVKLFLSGYWSEPRVEGIQDVKAGASIGATEAAILREPPLTAKAEPFRAARPMPQAPPPPIKRKE